MRVLVGAQAEVEVEAGGELVDSVRGYAAAQVAQVGEDLGGGEDRIEGELAGQVADQALDRDGLLPAIEVADRGAAGGGAQQPHEGADGGGLAGPVGA